MTRNVFTRIVTLTTFVLFIGVFIYYRIDGFEESRPATLASNSTTIASDTTAPRNSDSLLLEQIIDSLSWIRMSTSKSIVAIKDSKASMRAELKKDTARMRILLDLHKARQESISKAAEASRQSTSPKPDTANQHK